jgi:hypothetical protein|tara:strand:+ start:5782 stop:6033 length:252 start_codon:yes stop_codon:yes gene_type:complete
MTDEDQATPEEIADTKLMLEVETIMVEKIKQALLQLVYEDPYFMRTLLQEPHVMYHRPAAAMDTDFDTGNSRYKARERYSGDR